MKQKNQNDWFNISTPRPGIRTKTENPVSPEGGAGFFGLPALFLAAEPEVLDDLEPRVEETARREVVPDLRQRR